MNKSTIINISGIAFYIDEDAFIKLNNYLDKVHKYFETYEDKEEIIGDIENRIAEKFNEDMKNPHSVITLDKVNEVIKSMGETEDFLNEETETQKDSKELVETEISKIKKKLYRDPENKVIGGVASGLAAYTGLNADLIRIIFVILTLVPSSPGFFIYILLLIFAPEANSITERIEMTGEPMTLENIGNVANQKTVNQSNSRIRTILLFPFRIIGWVYEIFRKFSKHILTKLIGVALVLIGLWLFVSTSFFTSLVAFQKDSPLIDSPLKTFPSTGGQYTAIWLAYLTIIIPLICLMILGVSIFKRKYILKGWASFILFTSWVLSITGTACLFFNYAPDIKRDYETYYYHDAVEITNFDKVNIDYMGNVNTVKIKKGDKPTIKINGSLKQVSYEVKDSELKVFRSEDNFKVCLFCENWLDLEITTPDLVSYKDMLSSGVYVSIEGFDQNENLTLESSTHVYLKGKSRNLYINGRSFSLGAFDFEAENIFIKLYEGGTAVANLNVTKSLVLDIPNQVDRTFGNSHRIVYRGSPEVSGNYPRNQVFSEKEYDEYQSRARYTPIEEQSFD